MYVCVCIDAYVYADVYLYACMCMYVYVYVCRYVCMYVLATTEACILGAHMEKPANSHKAILEPHALDSSQGDLTFLWRTTTTTTAGCRVSNSQFWANHSELSRAHPLF